MFEARTYIERRKKLIGSLNSGIIIFLGNDESPMNYEDNQYRFRQDSSFLYFFGLSYPGLYAVVDIDEGSTTIFGDELTVDDIVWMGTQPTIKEKSLEAGVERTSSVQDFYSFVEESRKKGRKIHYLPPYRAEHILKLSRITLLPPDKIKNEVSVEFIKAVVEQRNYKSPEEVKEIEKAVNISADMHLAAYRMIRPGITEAEVAAEVHRTALAAGGDLSFPIIATIHGETLHNHFHGNTLKQGDLFLLDAGAETEMGYAGDLSSTMPVNREFTEKQKEIYQITVNAHEAAAEMLRPGIRFKDVHLKACETIAQGMKDLGFMKGDIQEAVSQGAHALFFPCGTGHMMGLDVHDMENLGEKYVGYKGEEKSTQFGLKSLRLARELEPGFVLTIEPGIYFIPELIDKWKAENKFKDFINYDKVESYKDFGGMRNEEDFLITDQGARLLGKEIPKRIDDVEAIRSL